MKMYRDLNSIPVMAKAGTIIPFTEEIHSKQIISNPKQITLKVFPGDNGYFEMYEDDNESCEYEKGKCVKTAFYYSESSKLQLIIKSSQGDLSLIPTKRDYCVEFYGLKEPSYEQLFIEVDGSPIDIAVKYDKKKQVMILDMPEIGTVQNVVITLDKELLAERNCVIENCFNFLNQAEIEFDIKERVYALIKKEERIPVLLAQLQKMKIEEELLGALTELITAKTN